MNITKEMGRARSALVMIPYNKHQEVMVGIAKDLSKKRVCYVTLNKTYDSLIEDFKKNKVSTKNMVFIDAITHSIRESPKEQDNCYFVSSPGSLTELSIVISKFLKYDFDYVVFDSLTNMSIYVDSNSIERFIFSLVNKIKETKNANGIFYAINTANDKSLAQHVGLFADKVIRYR